MKQSIYLLYCKKSKLLFALPLESVETFHRKETVRLILLKSSDLWIDYHT